MKRLLALFLTTAIVIVNFFACDLDGASSYQGTMQIPDDGIINRSIIEQIKSGNAVVTFKGESNGIAYEWTIFGHDIVEIEELNLGLEITESDKRIDISFLSKDQFSFSPAISIYSSTVWNAQNATVFDINGAKLCGASIAGSKKSILNFIAVKTIGEIFITANEPDATPNPEGDTTLQNSHQPNNTGDPYLSLPTDNGGHIISDGSATGKDKYQTDPIPEGKPLPVEPEDTNVDETKTYTCTFSIECSTILNNLDMLNPDKLDALPSNGVILSTQTVTFYEGESVFDVLQRICKEKNIQMEASWTPMYNSAYVEGIHNLYEFDCGSLSGWMYRVNGWYPNYGCSRYQLAQGDVVEWRYTCDLGKDVGCDWLAGSEQ